MACYEKDCHYVMTHDGDCFYEGLPMDKKENCPMYKAKTNADRIRAMTDEELAEFLWDEWMDRIICEKMDTKESMLKWLKKEVDDG